MFKPTLLSLSNIGLYTLNISLLRYVELLETLNIVFFIESKVTS
jgi:hypothetical protein